MAIRKAQPSDYRLLKTPADIKALLQYLRDDLVGMDYETTQLYPWHGRVRSVALSDKAGRAWCFDPHLAPDAFRAWLRCPTKRVVVQKASFEQSWSLKEFGEEIAGLVWDTKLGSRMIDENAPNHLGDIAVRYSGMGNYKVISPDFESEEWVSGQFPLEDFYHYNCLDADATRRASVVQAEEVPARLMRKTLEHVGVMARCRDRGVRIAEGGVDRLEELSRTEVPRLMAEMEAYPQYRAFVKANEGPLNVKSPKQVRRVLLDYFMLPVLHRSNKTGTATCDGQYLDIMAERSPFCALLREVRSWLTLDKNYLKNIRETEVDGKVHPDWGVGLANTWRITCSKPNLQNLANGSPLLEIFIPDPGHVWVELDYSQMELRILAALTGEPSLVQAFKDGRDPHRQTASEIFSKPYDEVSDAERSAAKSVNFGTIYGITADGLYKKFGIDRTEGRALLTRFWEKMTRIADWVSEQHRLCKRDGYVENLFGRRRHLTLKGQAFREKNQAQNFPVQSVSGEMTLDAMVELDRMGLHLLGQKHDSIFFQVLEENLEESIITASSIMEEQGIVLGGEIPFSVDCKVGASWGQLSGYQKASGVGS